MRNYMDGDHDSTSRSNYQHDSSNSSSTRNTTMPIRLAIASIPIFKYLLLQTIAFDFNRLGYNDQFRIPVLEYRRRPESPNSPSWTTSTKLLRSHHDDHDQVYWHKTSLLTVAVRRVDRWHANFQTTIADSVLRRTRECRDPLARTHTIMTYT